ncbi:MAG TPA: hypothetical protein VH641_04835 [Streptosporangiaceae bacterium]|jgi:uncharacterized membrane protein
MASGYGYSQAVADGPLFLAFLVPHILAGLTATAAGLVSMAAPKSSRLHARMGTVYYRAVALLAVSAAGLTAIHPARDLYLLVLGGLTLALAHTGRRRRGYLPHILAMTGSYTVLLTAFLADNGSRLPLAGRLPEAAYWLLPAAIATLLTGWALHRHAARLPSPHPIHRGGRGDGGTIAPNTDR